MLPHLRHIGLAFLACLATATSLAGQVDTVRICSGETANLQGPNGYIAYFWSPEELLQSNNRVRVETVPLTEPTGFEVLSIRPVGDNLIDNGFFSDGNRGFTSEYALQTDTRRGPGTYSIESSPRDFDPTYEDCPDSLEPSTGQFLVGDGGQRGQAIWCQTVDVKPNTSYSLRFFFASLTTTDPPSPAQFAARIDGEQLGSTVTAERITCVWRSLFRIFATGNRTSIEVCITGESQGSQGNDFGLDRIELNELEEPRVDSFLVIPQAPQSEVTTLDVSVCPGDRFTEFGLDLGVGDSARTVLTSSIGCDSTILVRVLEGSSSAKEMPSA